MDSNRRWQIALFKRVLANALVSGILVAIAGLLCGAITGAMAGWIAQAAATTVGIPATSMDRSPSIFMASTGAGGLLLGLLVGTPIFAIVAARAQPGRTFEPLRALGGRVIVGLIAGTLGFCSLFLGVEWARATLTSQSFYLVAFEDLKWLFMGVPALMICGAIAGVLSKRDAR